MLNQLQILLIIILVNFLIGINMKKPCYAYEKMPYKLFASKTSYDEVRGYTTRPTDYPGCSAIQFYLLSRHGARYPNVEIIRKLRDRLPFLRDAIIISSTKGKGDLCNIDVENLRNWHNHLSEDQADTLAPAGESDAKEIGYDVESMRFKIRFPTLLKPPRSRRGIDIRVSALNRTKLTAKFFMMGLWGDESILPTPVVDDNLLRFYKKCRLWNNNVVNNYGAVIEAVKFSNSLRIEQLIHDVTSRMGLNRRLTQSDIELMYDACRFEAAWDADSVSPWCAAFRSEELKLLEDIEDIRYYYKHGYGHEINYAQACAPIKDLVERLMSKAANNRSEPAIVLRFGTSGMFVKVITRLGLYKDKQPLIASKYKQQMNRVWRTSQIIPFGANMAIILLECQYEERVAIFLQEREIFLKGCSSQPCPLPEFLRMFQPIAEHCDVDKICRY